MAFSIKEREYQISCVEWLVFCSVLLFVQYNNAAHLWAILRFFFRKPHINFPFPINCHFSIKSEGCRFIPHNRWEVKLKIDIIMNLMRYSFLSNLTKDFEPNIVAMFKQMRIICMQIAFEFYEIDFDLIIYNWSTLQWK